MMNEAFPNDILYLNVFAEAKLKSGKIPEACQIFDDAVIKDDQNKRLIPTLGQKGVTNMTEADYQRTVSHRAFCDECFQPIRGIRQKCTYTQCIGYDCCTKCLNRQREHRVSSDPCKEHRRILIPSPERLIAESVEMERVLGSERRS